MRVLVQYGIWRRCQTWYAALECRIRQTIARDTAPTPPDADNNRYRIAPQRQLSWERVARLSILRTQQSLQRGTVACNVRLSCEPPCGKNRNPAYRQKAGALTMSQVKLARNVGDEIDHLVRSRCIMSFVGRDVLLLVVVPGAAPPRQQMLEVAIKATLEKLLRHH